MSRREYRIVKIGDTYYPQVRAGWRTLWRWLGIWGTRAMSGRGCGQHKLEWAREKIRDYEEAKRRVPAPMLVVEHTAPVERFDWATVAVDEKENCKCANS